MHLETLTLEGRKILSKIDALPDFYLAGGTGLALQLGHRISVDFGFMSSKVIPSKLLNTAEKLAGALKLSSRIVVNNRGELTLFIGETKLTFLHYPFPVLSPLVSFEKIRIASILEIAAMKAYTLGRRGVFKDYVDIYFILKNGEPLKSIGDLASQKYGDSFDMRLFLEQLVYLRDIEDTYIKFLKGKVDKKKLQKFFEEKIRQFSL